MMENRLILVGELASWEGTFPGCVIVRDAVREVEGRGIENHSNVVLLAKPGAADFADFHNVLFVDSVEDALPHVPALLRAEGGGMARVIGGVLVRGRDVDEQTRCRHYHSEVDIIAIRFPCCNWFSPCAECHEETNFHPPSRWSAVQQDVEAVLCGQCGNVMTIRAYQGNNSRCPFCGACFNPGCRNHWHLYFEE